MMEMTASLEEEREKLHHPFLSMYHSKQLNKEAQLTLTLLMLGVFLYLIQPTSASLKTTADICDP